MSDEELGDHPAHSSATEKAPLVSSTTAHLAERRGSANAPSASAAASASASTTTGNDVTTFNRDGALPAAADTDGNESSPPSSVVDALHAPPAKIVGAVDALMVPTTIAGIFTSSGLWAIVVRRTGLLVSLLLLQSLSQFVLEHYEHLITYHVVVPLFLTMLVGAGGNAGNQASVRVIAGLVTGQYTVADTWRVLRSEIAIGLVNGLVLALIGFTRVYWMYEEGTELFWSAFAITLSLFCIVVTSAVLGTLLPFFLEWIGVDREAAAPAIQVVMDICGVLITCVVCSAIIPASEHQTAHGHGHGHSTTTTSTPLPFAPKHQRQAGAADAAMPATTTTATAMPML